MPAAILKDQLIGRVLNNAFRIDHLLAEGTMSRVYLGEQVRTKRQVAIKVLRPWLNDVDFIDLFLRSARTYSELDHPNIVGVVNSGRADQLVYVAMEYVAGSTLSEIVNHKGLSLANILWVMEQVCAGVQAAQKHGVLHLDIKPSNIMVCKKSGDETTAEVLDFGIGRPLTDEHAEHNHRGMAMGLPGFISPEQISGEKNLDERADVYALGAILYYMLAGKKPYDGMNPDTVMQRQLDQAPERLRVVQLADPYAWKLQPIIFKAMEIKREDRYPNVMALWQDILKQVNPETCLKVSDEAANQPVVSKYMFVFRGELEEGADINKAKTTLQTILNSDSQKTEKLFTQERSVIRKDISHESAKRFADLFKLAGATGYIEEMEQNTHSLSHSKDLLTLPSADMASPILVQDIPGLDLKPAARVYQTSTPELVAVASTVVEQAIASESAASESATEHTVVTEPEATKIEIAKPEKFEQEVVKTETIQNELVANETVTNEVVQHEIVQPEVTQVKDVQPVEVVNAETDEANNVQVQMAQPEATQSETIQSETIQSETAEQGAVKSEAPQAAVMPIEIKHAELIQPQVAQTEQIPHVTATKQEPVQPIAIQPEVIQSEAAQHASHHQVSEVPHVEDFQPQVSPPEVAEADVSQAGVQFGASQQSWPQPSSIKLNAARQSSEPLMKPRKVIPNNRGPIQFTHGPSLDLSALSFGSSSFQIAGMPQNSVGKSRMDAIMDLSMSSSKLTISALGILFVITAAGYALFSPQMTEVVSNFLLKSIG